MRAIRRQEGGWTRGLRARRRERRKSLIRGGGVGGGGGSQVCKSADVDFSLPFPTTARLQIPAHARAAIKNVKSAPEEDGGDQVKPASPWQVTAIALARQQSLLPSERDPSPPPSLLVQYIPACNSSPLRKTLNTFDRSSAATSRREHFRQLPRVDHLLHDVQSADKLALDDELRERRPSVEVLELCVRLRSAPKGEAMGRRDALCRTLSSLRISKVVYSSPCFSRIPMIFCEKPHLDNGESGVSYMVTHSTQTL